MAAPEHDLLSHLNLTAPQRLPLKRHSPRNAAEILLQPFLPVQYLQGSNDQNERRMACKICTSICPRSRAFEKNHSNKQTVVDVPGVSQIRAPKSLNERNAAGMLEHENRYGRISTIAIPCWGPYDNGYITYFGSVLGSQCFSISLGCDE